jgi:NTE family protein
VTVSLRGRRRSREPAARPPQGDAFVLSGGGSLGAVQVGALRAVLEAGIRPDLFVGCSVGALNAAFLAADPSTERVGELEELWRKLDRTIVFPSSRRSVATHLIRREAHLYEPDGLRALIRDWIPYDDLASTMVPCHVVTTDLVNGQPCWWASGDPMGVLVATASLPGLLPPVELRGSLHVDGGVTCPVPAQRAVELGAERIWVLDVTGGSLGRRDERMSALDVLLLSFAITRQRLGATDITAAPGQRLFRLPSVNVGRHDLRDFSRTTELLDLGYTAGRQLVTEAMGARVGVPG